PPATAGLPPIRLRYPPRAQPLPPPPRRPALSRPVCATPLRRPPLRVPTARLPPPHLHRAPPGVRRTVGKDHRPAPADPDGHRLVAGRGSRCPPRRTHGGSHKPRYTAA